MKKQAITLSLLTLTALPASAAIDCAVIPTCAELGYNDTVASCMDQDNVLKCPFDKTLGKCLGTGAVVGQIGYFYKDPGEGWLVCNGYYYSKEQYPDLYSAIGTNFGGSGNVFRVPDYSGTGVFLKPSTSSSASMSKGCVPNIKATGFFTESHDSIKPTLTGAMYLVNTTKNAVGSNGGTDSDNWNTAFDASKYNSIYSNYCAVPTPNYYAIGTYIYAGKKVASASSAAVIAKTCAKGQFLYTDGTCSSSVVSGKTVKGIVTSAYAGSTYTSVGYIYGGTSSVYGNSFASAEYTCTNKGETLASQYYSETSYIPASISTSQSVVAPRASGKYYWFSGYTTKQYCSTATSCSSSTTTNNADGSYCGPTYPCGYCTGTLYFK